MKELIPATAAAAPAAPAILSTLAAIAPPVIAGLVIGGFVCWVWDEIKKKPEVEPTPSPVPDPCPQLAAPNVTRGAVNLSRPHVHRRTQCQPASRSAAPALSTRRVVDLPAPVLKSSTLGSSLLSAPAPAPQAKADAPVLFSRKLTADKMAAVFANGPLTRQAAVVALVAAGASRSRAYEALREDGAFAANLVFSPEGSIGWQA